MPRSKVVVNRRIFGEQVMSSSELEEQLQPFAEEVASRVPGATIRAVRTSTIGGGARVRLRVEAQIYERDDLVSAVRGVINTATPR
jgi:glutamine amidotransferase PdxT